MIEISKPAPIVVTNVQPETHMPLYQIPSIADFFSIDGESLLFYAVVVVTACLLSLPIAIERSRVASGLGLRTVSIVATACCGYVLMAASVFESDDAQAKMLYGVITGIGFIGAGALFKSESGVRGTASAASVWSAAAIGVAVGMGAIELAIILSVLTSVTLYFFSRPKEDSDCLELKKPKKDAHQ